MIIAYESSIRSYSPNQPLSPPWHICEMTVLQQPEGSPPTLSF